MPAQPKRESDQGYAEDQRIRAYPPGQDKRADHRAGEQQQAVEHRNGAAEYEHPASMADLEAEGGGEHQGAGYERPNRYDHDESKDSEAGPERGGDADNNAA